MLLQEVISIPTARVNDLEIHYRDVGAGSPLVLIHGYTGNLRNWNGQLALRQSWRLVAVDLPGHGYSARPSAAQTYGLDAMAEVVYALMGALEIDATCVAGHSMGGMIAQELALAHPDALSALVLVDTSGEPVASLRMPERKRLLEIARTEDMEAVFNAEIAQSAPNESEDVIRMWRQQFLLTSREAYIHCAEAIAGRPSLLDKLTRLSVPTLVICGERDDPFLQPSRRLAESIPDSELVVIPECGHSPQMENPEAFNQALMRFLRGLKEREAISEEKHAF